VAVTGQRGRVSRIHWWMWIGGGEGWHMMGDELVGDPVTERVRFESMVLDV
jgi:hypothetical protein